MDRLIVLWGFLLAVSLPAWEGKPNILFIMADDLGWMDLAVQGNKLVETPNLDRLAKQGMRFTDAYAAAPVCSPTRCAVLTGQAQVRSGIADIRTWIHANLERKLQTGDLAQRAGMSERNFVRQFTRDVFSEG